MASERKISILAAPLGREEQRQQTLNASDVVTTLVAWRTCGLEVSAAHLSLARPHAANRPDAAEHGTHRHRAAAPSRSRFCSLNQPPMPATNANDRTSVSPCPTSTLSGPLRRPFTLLTDGRPPPFTTEPRRPHTPRTAGHAGRVATVGWVLCPDREWPHSLPIDSPSSAGR